MSFVNPSPPDHQPVSDLCYFARDVGDLPRSRVAAAQVKPAWAEVADEANKIFEHLKRAFAEISTEVLCERSRGTLDRSRAMLLSDEAMRAIPKLFMRNPDPAEEDLRLAGGLEGIPESLTNRNLRAECKLLRGDKSGALNQANADRGRGDSEQRWHRPLL